MVLGAGIWEGEVGPEEEKRKGDLFWWFGPRNWKLVCFDVSGTKSQPTTSPSLFKA